jgi:alkaline phosphatase D
MNRPSIVLSIVLAIGQFVVTARSSSSADEPLSRISFGSCAKQNQPMPILDAIVKTDPQLFLMIGDNIYGDTEDMGILWEKYQLLGAQPGFQKLREHCPMLATWDDHDY